MQKNVQSAQPFADWLTAMLQRRELARPDGRPLYRYRLSVDEFDVLRNLLRQHAGMQSCS